MNTQGSFTVEPFSTSFAGPVTLSGSRPVSDFIGSASFANLTIKQPGMLGGLVLGKPGNTSDLRVTDVWNVNGDMGFYGGHVTFDSAITAGVHVDKRLDVMADRLVYDQFMGGVIHVRPTTPGTPLFVTGPGAPDEPGLQLTNSLDNIGASTHLIFGDATSGDARIGGGKLNGQPTLEIRTGGNLALFSHSELSNKEQWGSMMTGATRVVLDAAGSFINNAGAQALVADSGMQQSWVVYSRSPDGNVFGNLVSENTAVWGKTSAQVGADAALAGLNDMPARYVFREPGTVTLTTTAATKTYGQTAAVTGNVQLSGNALSAAAYGGVYTAHPISEILVAPATVTSAGSAATAGVGHYDILASAQALPGFQVSAATPAKLTVTPAPLTLTFGSAEKVYGDANPVMAGTLSGFVNGEDAISANVTGLAGQGNLPAPNADVGRYAVAPTAGTLAAPNYVVTQFVPGSVTITPRPTMLVGTREYDGTRAIAGADLRLGNVVGNDCAVVADCAITGLGELASKNVGQHAVSGGTLVPLNPSSRVWTNYVAVGGMVDITPKTLTLGDVRLAERVYDTYTTATVVDSTLRGAVAGESVSAHLYAMYRDKNAGVGKIADVRGDVVGPDAANYRLDPTATARGTITPAPITVSGQEVASKVYDEKHRAWLVDPTPRAVGLYDDNLVRDDVRVVTQARFVSSNAGKQVLANLSHELVGADAANYVIAADSQKIGFADITPKPITLHGATGLTKVYDGSTAVLGTGIAGLPNVGYTELDGVYAGDEVELSGAPRFDAANAGARSVVRGSLQLTGREANNYSLNWVDGSGLITPAPLVLRANDDAKFIGRADAANFAGVVATGLVNGETLASIGGVTVTRSNAGQQAAGRYDGVLLPVVTGDARNYEVRAVPGAFTIVPAGQLLVRVNNDAVTYGQPWTPSVAQAAYLDAAGNQVVDLTAQTSIDGRRVTVRDGAAGTTGFDLAVQGVTLSGAGQYRVGDWRLGASQVVRSGVAMSGDMVLLGSLQVTPKVLSPHSGSVSKVYDGTTAISAQPLRLEGVLTGDQVSGHGQGAFDAKHAGSGLPYSLTGLALSGADASNYQLSGFITLRGNDGVITPRPVQAGGLVAADKVYDGTVAASVAADSASLQGRVAGDALALRVAGRFADKNVGVGKTLAIDAALVGADAANYQLVSVEPVNASITPRPITVQVRADDKVYDGQRATTVTVLRDDRVAGDALTLDARGEMPDANAGANKAVQVDVTLNGADAGNYRLVPVPTTQATVERRELTLNLGGKADKVYDGLTSVGAGLTVRLDGVLGTDVTVLGDGRVLRFADKNAGTGKRVIYDGFELQGAQAGNYVLAAAAATDASIAPRTLNLTVSGVDKTYDGHTAAQVRIGDDRVAGDVLSVGHAGAAFDDRHVGQGKTVRIEGLSLSGTDAPNYKLDGSTRGTTASITARDVVRWIGGPTGLLSSPANWAGGAVPDGVNVTRVDLPPGTIVLRDRPSAALGSSQDDVSAIGGLNAAATGAAADPTSSRATPDGARTAREEPGSSGLRWSQSSIAQTAPGVYVQVLELPAARQPGRVQVQLDLGIGQGSGFLLPPEVVRTLGEADGATVVEVVGRKRLPDWLKVDRQTMQVTLVRVPARALPLTLVLRRGDREVRVEILGVRHD